MLMSEQNRSVLSLSRKESWQLWRHWVLANLVAELAGLGLAVLVTTAMDWFLMEMSRPIQILLAMLSSILSGIVLGLAIGLAQWWVLHRYLPSLVAKYWLIVTGCGLVVGWFVGTVIGGAVNLNSLNIGMEMVTLGILLLTGILGGLLGFFQWLILRHDLPQASLWILANALAWTLGLVIAFTGAGLLPANLSLIWSLVLNGCIALVACGTIGVVHGLILIYLFRPPELSGDGSVKSGEEK